MFQHRSKFTLQMIFDVHSKTFPDRLNPIESYHLPIVKYAIIIRMESRRLFRIERFFVKVLFHITSNIPTVSVPWSCFHIFQMISQFNVCIQTVCQCSSVKIARTFVEVKRLFVVVWSEKSSRNSKWIGVI